MYLHEFEGPELSLGEVVGTFDSITLSTEVELTDGVPIRDNLVEGTFLCVLIKNAHFVTRD